MRDPQRLVDALTAHGWTVAGQRTGEHVRLTRPGVTDRSLVVPLDTTAPEFDQMWQATIRILEDTVAVGVLAARVLGDLWAPLGRVPGRMDRFREVQVSPVAPTADG